MKNVKVCIIVPIYNVEKYLKKCLTSIVNQDYENIEILAIDDGSTDNSAKIAKTFAKKDKRIRFFSKENGGYGSVLEYAINIMESNYFLVCDSDDYLEKNAVSVLIKNRNKFKTDLVIAEHYLVFCDGHKIEGDKYRKQFAIKPNEVYTDLTNFFFFSSTPHSKLYNTKIAKQIKFPHNVSYTDTILYFMYLEKAKNAVYVDTILSNYLLDRDGNSNTDFKMMNDRAYKSLIVVLESLIYQANKDSVYYPCICYNILACVISAVKRLERDNRYNMRIKQLSGIIDSISNEKNKMKKYIKEDSKIKYLLKRIRFNFLFNKLFTKSFLKLSGKIK